MQEPISGLQGCTLHRLCALGGDVTDRRTDQYRSRQMTDRVSTKKININKIEKDEL